MDARLMFTLSLNDFGSRMRYVFVLAFVIAFVGLSRVTDRGAREHGIVTGTVLNWRSDEFITIGRQTPDPGFEISLRPNTIYDGDLHGVKSGARVTVWYQNVAERRLVAERVRIFDAVAR